MHCRIRRSGDDRARSGVEANTRCRMCIHLCPSRLPRKADHLPIDAHIYGAFNFAVGIGASGKLGFIRRLGVQQTLLIFIPFTLFSGPGNRRRSMTATRCSGCVSRLTSRLGQIFERYSNGWTILNLGAVVIIIAACLMVALFFGERPLAKRLRESGPVLTRKLMI
jgi:hypothetical protein